MLEDPIVALYRAARTLRRGAFSRHMFAWLAGHVPNDRALAVTTFVGESTCLDVHFHRFEDLRTLVSGHLQVKHLYSFLPLLTGEPGRAHRQDRDASQYAGAAYAPLREHLDRVRAARSLFIAVPWAEKGLHTVLMVFRSRPEDVFTAEEVAALEMVAPHVVEAMSVNRMHWIEPEPDDGFHALATATLGADGRLLQITAAFGRLFWPCTDERTAYVPAPILAAVRAGRPWPLPGGMHVLHAHPDRGGGHVLRIQACGPTDRLAHRERQVARLFVRGASARAIASELGVSPTTVRNHLQSVYEKLTVSSRDELRALFDAQP